MKRNIALLLSIVLILSVFSVCAYAQEEDKYAPEKFSDEEYEAGFSFKYVNVLLKNEYSFQEFAPEMLNGELIGEIEEPYTFNPENTNYSKDTYQHFLILHLAEPTKENVLELYKQMKNCEYVDVAEIGLIDTYMPVYPDSPDEIGCYEGNYSPWIEPDNENYSGNMLFNPYYKLYYNELLEQSVATYNRFAEYITDVDYISYFAENYMNSDKNYVTLIFNEAETDSINTHNRAILNKYFSEEEILYIGDTVFAAVVCINKEYANKITQIDELAFIGDAFFADSSYRMSLCVTGQYALGDVIGEKSAMDADTENTVTAADARYILRYSAGLETVESELKRFYYCADMNFDGEIDASDARLALRTSAQLEQEYTIIFGYSYMWSDGIVWEESK
ncbi:MAG: hypothetical protein IJZ35_06515 [Clostridia bacterium]|nr:hypothetical protein [Clostridia bacterium]